MPTRPVEAANQSQYGLSGNLWTRDTHRARKIARRLETGGVFINGSGASNPRVPVGGVKNSGYGRKLSHRPPRSPLQDARVLPKWGTMKD